MRKTVLIVQDLGISQSDFNTIVARADLPYKFTTVLSHPHNVEGVITIKTPIGTDFLNKFPNLKFVAVAFTGYDCVNFNETRKRKITVFNVPTYATESTAELVIGLAISLLRDIPKSHQLIPTGGWELKPGIELAGKTVGIIGTGRIGIRVAELFTAFHCHLIGWSHSQRPEFIRLGGIYKNEIETVFKEADIVTIHLPLNVNTKEMINGTLLAKMKRTAYFMNVARGPIVNTRDLAEALTQGKIAGAAVDVFDQEPISHDNPLLKAPNSILTPHIAYKTREALTRRIEVTLMNIQAFVEGKPQNVVLH